MFWTVSKIVVLPNGYIVRHFTVNQRHPSRANRTWYGIAGAHAAATLAPTRLWALI